MKGTTGKTVVIAALTVMGGSWLAHKFGVKAPGFNG